ncbi:MAG TPA: phospholipid scramblase-related protein [Planctomycetota bacterium]|jgi:uncharacterized protein YxjI|nr:phospholipid scramblase-related protein [Planctomycetota bacterium]
MFDRRAFFIREHVGIMKLKDTYDILDPETKAPLGIAKETTAGWILALRFLINKQMLPLSVVISTEDGGTPLLTLSRGFTFLRSKVWIENQDGQRIGYFKSKLFSLGGGFLIYDMQDTKVADIKGDWKGWNFRFLDAEGKEIGLVTKKWAGIGKELFTSADNYLISINDLGAQQAAYGALLLAAGIAIDTVFKERG